MLQHGVKVISTECLQRQCLPGSIAHTARLQQLCQLTCAQLRFCWPCVMPTWLAQAQFYPCPVRTLQVASQALVGPQLRCAWRVRLAMGVASILSGIASGSSTPYSASAVVLSACLPGRSFLLRELHAKPSHQGLGPSLMLASTDSPSHESESLARIMLDTQGEHYMSPFKPKESGLPSQITYTGGILVLRQIQIQESAVK